MDDKSVRQMTLVKYYLALAQGQSKIDSEQAHFATIILLHEALEATLISCADYLNLKLGERVTIDQYLDKIDHALGGSALPFRSRILQFNRARVSAKHALTLPDRKTFLSALDIVPEFIRTITLGVFKVELDSIDLENLIENKEAREFIAAAKQLQREGAFYDGLAHVRKAFYILFEQYYDISCFIDSSPGEKFGLLDTRSLNNSPFYSRNKDYIAKNVKIPFDYIVLDIPRIDAELAKDGVDLTTFWNIWRLTPAVWRKLDGVWLVKHSIDIFENPSISSDLSYSIESIISIIIQMQLVRGLARYKKSYFKSIGVIENVSVYEKASLISKVVDRIPDGIDRVNVMEATQGLDTDDWFWSAAFMRKDGPFIFGYIRAADTVGELSDGVNPWTS